MMQKCIFPRDMANPRDGFTVAFSLIPSFSGLLGFVSLLQSLPNLSMPFRYFCCPRRKDRFKHSRDSWRVSYFPSEIPLVGETGNEGIFSHFPKALLHHLYG